MPEKTVPKWAIIMGTSSCFTKFSFIDVVLSRGNEALIHNVSIFFKLHPDGISVNVDFHDIQGITFFEGKGVSSIRRLFIVAVDEDLGKNTIRNQAYVVTLSTVEFIFM